LLLVLPFVLPVVLVVVALPARAADETAKEAG
jgi:hypothetical protein